MKIEQLAQAQGWHAISEEMTELPNGQITTSMAMKQLVAWALYDDGEVRGLVIGVEGKPVSAEDGGVLPFVGYATGLDQAHDIYEAYLKGSHDEDGTSY